MEKELTGYVIKDDYDLNNLKKYRFTKTSPVDINPWWQRPFDIKWDVFGTWDTELLVSRDDRKLMKRVKDGADTTKLQATLDEMIKDGVFVEVRHDKC